MVRLISRQRGGLAALKLTKLFGINDFPAAKDSGKVLIIIIYCYLIIIIIIILIIPQNRMLASFVLTGPFGDIGSPGRKSSMSSSSHSYPELSLV